ncbi:MAG TPA: E3 binding domain-containing protein, partial [Geobacteraceae bacterium]|nr:E3 binding domain-containing protein [Geobacteraceae bacterium]
MEIRVPEVGDSIVEALVAKWRRKDGDAVRREEPVCELETDKVTLELNAETDGILSILVPEGSTVAVGTVIGAIREEGKQDTAPVAPETPHPPISPAARRLAREKDIQPETVKGSGRKGRVL